ncbi:MAG: hypothetical protein ACTH31_11500 [Pseudoclavibacter sp.]
MNGTKQETGRTLVWWGAALLVVGALARAFGSPILFGLLNQAGGAMSIEASTPLAGVVQLIGQLALVGAALLAAGLVISIMSREE